MVRQAFSLWKAFIILLLFIPCSAFGQEYNVTGIITDKNTGETLPGVNILVKGTTTGKTTDADGNYSITLSQPSTLVFSFIGYTTQEIMVDATRSLNVALEPSIATFEEVVVIGYGTQKKVDKTGAVSHIASEDLGQGTLTDPIQGLQSKVAGVLITKKGGDPNSGFSVKIRGAAGFRSNTQPLYVIDGIPNADPTSIAPEDIESYSILKDAASSAIYGSQGSNGVILISTKKGTAGKGTIQFSSKISFDRVAKKLDLLTANQLRNFVTEYNSGKPDSLKMNFTDNGANVDWQDQIYRTGITQDYNLNFSGGNNVSTYYGSLTHAVWQGVMKGTSKERTTAKMNLSHKGLNDKLTLSGSLAGSFENNDYENYDGFDKDDIIYQALSHNPTDPVYDDNGGFFMFNREFNYENPLSVIENIDNLRNAKDFFGSFRADLEILPGLTGSANIGYTLKDSETSYFRPKGGVYATADNGFGKKGYDKSEQKLLELTGTYIKSFNNHNLNAVVGYSWQENKYNGFYAQAENPQSDFLKYNNLGSFIGITSSSIASWGGQSRLIGFFGRLQYNYNSKYYLTGSVRRDGSTKFGINNKWGWFPTVSAGWNLDKESFMQSITAINQLKFRISYGVSGNQKIGEYHSQVAFRPTGPATDPETGQQVTTFGPAWNSNPDLKWERTAETNIGIDFAIFSNRISGTIEGYQKITSDLLDEYPVDVPPNLARTTWANAGKMKNTGIELFLQAFLVEKANLKWKTSLNITHFKTILTDLGPITEAYRKGGYLTGRGLIGESNFVVGNLEGHELGSFYLPKFIKLDQASGKFWFLSDAGGAIESKDNPPRFIAGSPAPDLEIGWTNSINFLKNFDFEVSIRSMIGNDVYNATRMFFDYNGNLPSLNGVPEALDWAKQGRKDQPPYVSDYYVEDGSFVRLDYASLSYSLVPKSKYISNIRLSVTGNNLFLITGYSGVDPETNMEGTSFGIDQYDVYPKTRSVSFGVTATF